MNKQLHGHGVHVGRRSVVLITMLFLLSGCNIFELKPSLTLIMVEDTVEYGTKIDLKDYIKSYKYDDLSISEFDELTLGQQEIVYTARRGDKEISKTLRLNVVDRHAPTFNSKAEEILIMEGGTFDVSLYFEALDLIDGPLEVFVKERVDTSKIGVTTYTAVAEDKAKNQTAVNFNLVVKSKAEIASIDKNAQPPLQTKPNEPAKPNKPSTSQKPTTSVKPTAPSKPSTSKPSNKKFMFREDYSREQALNDCKVYIGKYPTYGRACLDLRDPNHPDIGIGYEAVFN